MSIQHIESTRLFHLKTKNSSYQMKADSPGTLLHLYYGEAVTDDMSYLVRCTGRPFSGNPHGQDGSYSLDTLPQEYAGSGVGDYRLPAVQVIADNGSRSVNLTYNGFRIIRGRETPADLPYVRGDGREETLEIALRDPVIGLQVQLNYTVFEEEDVIVRSAKITNLSEKTIHLEKAASACIDFLYGRYDMLHFHGRHCMERRAERIHLPNGISSFGSRRGMSSHHSNPFVILCDTECTENAGNCYGLMLMYSGNHLEEAERDQTGSTRVVTGIHPDGFSWQLNPGDSFQTPEAILSFSAAGLNGLSGQYHRLLLKHVIPEKFRGVRCPVLINSWEAAYFDFDAEKILRFARSAKELGMEMLVLDDGWFGHRDDDKSSLGDWTVNEAKLGCSLKALSEQIHALGLRFGLWFEPEMISEDSELYRKHPDWALADPDRKPTQGRNQLVLDMSRPEIVDYLFEAMSAILDHAQIEYVKWDFNRSVANLYSAGLSAQRQGELGYRFMLGTYRLLDRLLKRYPDLMIEGCAGGGGRFDAGMLFYCPQIWCSDDTDAIERLEIQRGTSYGYPVSAVGSHVSASPNHQTGRAVPLYTRGIVAQSGTFGYELNPEALSDADKEEIRKQIAAYHQYSGLITQGRYYRLNELDSPDEFSAWMFVSEDQSEALVNLVISHIRANGPLPFIKLCGLSPEKAYRLDGTDQVYSGAALMHGGYSFELPFGDYTAMQLHFLETTL
jgi:alpha-galactosidase